VCADMLCVEFRRHFGMRSYDTVTRSGFLAADCTDSTKPMGAMGPMYVRDSEAKQDLKSCVFISGFAR